jgi:hypothetical protein
VLETENVPEHAEELEQLPEPVTVPDVSPAHFPAPEKVQAPVVRFIVPASGAAEEPDAIVNAPELATVVVPSL